MKKYLFALFFMSFYIINDSVGQDIGPAKGYYSIHGKKEQLSSVKNPVHLNSQEGKYPAIQKGYYSITGNAQKLPEETRIYLQPAKLVAPKGYYSMPHKADSGYRKN
ncbi:hypothetical protein [Flavihumibacter fluvii]|uniref:hypothetical protein n=1 Tax=Flavihumibacter fluvii TaxID=2838157 RepID=UPI001BDEFAC7|nr:hypothetical protein [Flavihumibacter fluvii]ULQ52663.1 hypothetical protein KJS93_21475 [Flavihumibacter fluvii]